MSVVDTTPINEIRLSVCGKSSKTKSCLVDRSWRSHRGGSWRTLSKTTNLFVLRPTPKETTRWVLIRLICSDVKEKWCEKFCFLYSLQDMRWFNHVCREIFRSQSVFLLTNQWEKLLKLQSNSRRYGSFTCSLAFGCMLIQSKGEKCHIWCVMCHLFETMSSEKQSKIFSKNTNMRI